MNTNSWTVAKKVHRFHPIAEVGIGFGILVGALVMSKTGRVYEILSERLTWPQQQLGMVVRWPGEDGVDPGEDGNLFYTINNPLDWGESK
jgi:hypothetical protein